jgi:ATP-binding cassette, subfamily B, bacterial PglK
MPIAFRKIWSLLDARERRRAVIVLGLLVLVAFVDVLGVASIMPFIAVLANPEAVETNRYLAAAYAAFGFESREGFLFALGILFFSFLIASLTLRALGFWARLRFSHNRELSWGTRLVAGYLRQPYEWFLNRHSADLSTAILAEVKQVIGGALFPAMQLIAHVLLAIFLIALLIAVDPVLAVVVAGLLGGSYLAISMAVQLPLRRIGVERRLAQRARFHVVQEAFGGIKDLKIMGLEETQVGRFQKPAEVLASRQISASLISELPSFAMQALLFGGMLLVLLYLMTTRGGFQEALPVIAVYAFAGYRLMPALQHIYQDMSQMRFTEPALDSLCTDFATLDTQPTGGRSRAQEEQSRLRLHETLVLEDVAYGYPNAAGKAVDQLSMHIPAYSTVGLVGSTGSGKTTTVDLILGLLRPQAGRILVDGQELTDDRVRPWQRSLGYVPQQIFLSDDTVAGNIAFGLSENRIDMDAVERAARIANLHDFVVSELPEGYQTRVGERGVRLSGGQRQRIGIARALYHDPDVLILDEATSALDNLTEQAVMEAVNNLGHRKTIILIAHRLTTVRNCDRIFLLERGHLMAYGTYDELVASNERFRALAAAV